MALLRRAALQLAAVCAISALFLCNLCIVRVSSQPNATVVYGQDGSFTNEFPEYSGYTRIAAGTLYYPFDVAADANGGVYVADTYNNRVLYYAANSTIASRVYGQRGSFTSSDPGSVNANSLDFPTAVAVTASGVLISDTNSNRVLAFSGNSTTAVAVYGQHGSFTSDNSCPSQPDANCLSIPRGLAVDASGNVYIADSANNRVLFFVVGNTTATRVYGQLGSFSSSTFNNGGVSANSLALPFALAVTSAGLFIVDQSNSRVLFYPANSTTATVVYGQLGNFTSAEANIEGQSANSLNYPRGIAVNANTGDVYIADWDNENVLAYPNGSTTATAIYGQSNFISSVGGQCTAALMAAPTGVALSHEFLYVSDGPNNRVLGFPLVPVPPLADITTTTTNPATTATATTTTPTTAATTASTSTTRTSSASSSTSVATSTSTVPTSASTSTTTSTSHSSSSSSSTSTSPSTSSSSSTSTSSRFSSSSSSSSSTSSSSTFTSSTTTPTSTITTTSSTTSDVAGFGTTTSTTVTTETQTQTSTPSQTRTTTSFNSTTPLFGAYPASSSVLSTTLLIAVIAGGGGALLLIVVLVCCWKKRNRNTKSGSSPAAKKSKKSSNGDKAGGTGYDDISLDGDGDIGDTDTGGVELEQVKTERLRDGSLSFDRGGKDTAAETAGDDGVGQYLTGAPTTSTISKSMAASAGGAVALSASTSRTPSALSSHLLATNQE